MYRMKVTRALPLVPLMLLIGAGCDSAPTAPTVSDATAPAYSVDNARANFSQNLTIPVPSVCLGGTFLISGTISGWYEDVITPIGGEEYKVHTDFSALTASFGGESWTALPGSHEIFSWSLPPRGQAARLEVHEGRTRFDPDDGTGPRIEFIHRIHALVLPSGELQFDNVTFEAVCRGPGD